MTRVSEPSVSSNSTRRTGQISTIAAALCLLVVCGLGNYDISELTAFGPTLELSAGGLLIGGTSDCFPVPSRAAF